MCFRSCVKARFLLCFTHNYKQNKPRSDIKGICEFSPLPHSIYRLFPLICLHYSFSPLFSFSSTTLEAYFRNRDWLETLLMTARQLKPTAHIAIWTKHITIHTIYCTCVFAKQQTNHLQLSGTQLIYL